MIAVNRPGPITTSCSRGFHRVLMCCVRMHFLFPVYCQNQLHWVRVPSEEEDTKISSRRTIALGRLLRCGCGKCFNERTKWVTKEAQYMRVYMNLFAIESDQKVIYVHVSTQNGCSSPGTHQVRVFHIIIQLRTLNKKCQRLVLGPSPSQACLYC